MILFISLDFPNLHLPTGIGKQKYQQAVSSVPIHFLRKTISDMLKWALIFLILAVIAAIFGFGGLAVAFAQIAKIIFFIFVVILVVVLILGFSRGW
jgi:uncharacterized membrane protein YtjA (UPF0391 family)